MTSPDWSRTSTHGQYLCVYWPNHPRTYRNGYVLAHRAVKDFLEEKKPELKARTHRDYTRLLNRHGFKNERLTDITPHDIIKKLSKLAPSEKFHAHVALNIFFRAVMNSRSITGAAFLLYNVPGRDE